MLTSAFNQEYYKIENLPEWMTAETYDFEARADRTLTREEAALMFQSIFFDRFNLRFHHQIKDVAGLSLVVAEGGLKVQKIENQNPLSAKEENTTIQLVHEVTKRPVAASTPGPVLLTTKKSTISWFANYISRLGLLGRPIVDGTGLDGYYEFSVNFQSDSDQGVTTVERSRPALPTALVEQLGLKLQSSRVSVDFMVIDRIDRPSAN